MIVKKILNNNLLLVENKEGKEHIAMGKGLRFTNKVGEPLNEIDVEKIYILKDENNTKEYLRILENSPSKHIDIIQEAIQLVNQKMDTVLNERIFITLLDHLTYAIERFEKNITLQNRMLWEIQKFYPKEYFVACDVLSFLNEQLGIELPQEEAGNIAFHIINAIFDDIKTTETMNYGMIMVKMLKDICQIIKIFYQCKIDENSVHYTRFIVHLQFFLQRVLEDHMLKNNDISIYESVVKGYTKEVQCVEQIKKYIKNLLGKDITKEEGIYLMIYINRIVEIK